MLNQVILAGFQTDRADGSSASALNFLKSFNVYLSLNVTTNIKQPRLRANPRKDHDSFLLCGGYVFLKTGMEMFYIPRL